MAYWVTCAVLLIYLVLVWFIGTWANPPGAGIWVLRVGLWLLGLLGAGFSIWWLRRRDKAAGPPDATPVAPALTAEIDQLVREAVRRLKSSALGRGASLGNLPLIFLVGDPGSAKTTTIIHSALDPELLAGQVYQDSAVLPTRIANFWYTRQAVFVDAAGGIYSQPDFWKRLIKLVQPGRVASAGKKQQAPRAAIVCFDCESFLRPGASEATLSAARRLGARLIEISQVLGISFPIYVLFTRADRIGARADGGSLFLDYVAGLTKDEASQVLGATLPVRSLQASGVYAEEETKRLAKAFDELFYSLAEKRVDLLSIAGQTEKLPGIYEFPRELRKLRQLLVQFLVDLARPSQLNVNPFLRGFYFSGVRASVIDEVASALPEAQAPDSAFNPNATVIFGASARAPQAPVASRMPTSRKVPEWVFLSQLFNEVLLKDRVALSASGFSSRVSLLRRVAFAVLAVIAVVFAIGFLTSFLYNLSLEHSVKQAADEVRVLHATPNQTPTIDQLQKLDRLRQELETLSTYDREGTPWHLRWWLYSGDDLYPPARQIYFDRFSDLLFGETQGRLRNSLLAVKGRPDPTDSYQIPYNDLRAYLITTSFPKNSTRDFLSPVLMKHWLDGRTPDDSATQLARSQFDFYSTELATANPYSITPDFTAINRARDYLGGFSGIERYYFPLLEKAHTATNQDLTFRSKFPNSVGVVDAPYTIRAAFTKEGFDAISTAINAPANQMSEAWVVGKATAEELDPTILRQKLKERYTNDFIQEWRNLLDRSHVLVSQNNPAEAAAKLEVLTSASSPLLELLWFISHNTKVTESGVADVFAPVQAIVPPGPDRGLPTELKLGSNAAYMDALSKLREDLSILSKTAAAPGDTHLADAANISAEAAKTAAGKLAGNQLDPKYRIPDLLDRLLREPVIDAQVAIGGAGKQGLNGAGLAFCHQFDPIRNYFPFNPTGPDLPVDQLNALFAPNTGALWALNAKLGQFISKQGSTYVPNNSSSIRINPTFVGFFNRAAALSDALYPAGSPTPHVSFSLKQASTNIQGLALKVGSDTLSGPGSQKSFTWTGAGEDVQVTANNIPIGSWGPGVWAAFRFINDGHPAGRGLGIYDLEFVYKQSNGQDVIVNGQKQSYSYQLQFTGPNPWPNLSGFSCVSPVAR